MHVTQQLAVLLLSAAPFSLAQDQPQSDPHGGIGVQYNQGVAGAVGTSPGDISGIGGSGSSADEAIQAMQAAAYTEKYLTTSGASIPTPTPVAASNYPAGELDGLIRPLVGTAEKISIRYTITNGQFNLQPSASQQLIIQDPESKVKQGSCDHTSLGSLPLNVPQSCVPATYQYTLLNRTAEVGKNYTIAFRMDHTVHYAGKQVGPHGLNGTVTKSLVMYVGCFADPSCPKVQFYRGVTFAQQAPAGWIGDAIN